MNENFELDNLEDYGDDDSDMIDYYGLDQHDVINQIIQNYQHEVSHYDMVGKCVVPTVRETVGNFLLLIVFYNLVAYIALKLLKHVRLADLLLRIPSLPFNWLAINLERLVLATTGLALLYHHFSVAGDVDDRFFVGFVLVCLLAPLVLVPLQALSYHRAGVLWLVSLVIISTNEALVQWSTTETKYIKLRIILMLVVMKSISYYYEVQHTDLVMRAGPSPLFRWCTLVADFAAYLLHPSSLLFGAWHPPKKTPTVVPETTTTKSLSFLGWVGTLLWTTALTVLFLLITNCFISYYLNQLLMSWLYHWLHNFVSPSLDGLVTPTLSVLQAYFTAIEFHYSHYFICYAAQIMFVLWDFGLQITDPVSIEVPRSLAEVVRAWNIPMHLWLKRYVFRKFRAQYGIQVAILATYVISSYLHGFNFQIWSVLLSLGLCSYAEFELRKQLSNIFGACMGSHKCSYYSFDRGTGLVLTCSAGHSHTGQHVLSWVRLVNALFTFLGLLNLAFLGSTFDGQLDSSSIAHVLSTWRGLYFYSHGMAIVMYLLSKLI